MTETWWVLVWEWWCLYVFAHRPWLRKLTLLWCDPFSLSLTHTHTHMWWRLPVLCPILTPDRLLPPLLVGLGVGEGFVYSDFNERGNNLAGGQKWPQHQRDHTKTKRPTINKAFVASSGDLITGYNGSYCIFTHRVASCRINITMSAFVIGETTSTTLYSQKLAFESSVAETYLKAVSQKRLAI